MVVFPNAKINLGLRIIRKRGDGYHDIESVFYPVAFTDILEIIPSQTDTPFQLSITGIPVTVDPLENLCAKAFQLLKKDFPQLPSIEMHLHKAIPAGAGLGGGSSDASFTLKLLDTYFKLGLDQSSLLHYALQLGSDCPFFIINSPCLATGRGEILETISLDLHSYHFLIVNPGIHINTGQAFSQISPSTPAVATKEIITGPIENWKNELLNDFELPVFRQYPEIAIIKKQLYEAGAVYASLSGSGSTVYGIFKKDQQPELLFPKNYFVHWSVGKH